MIASHFHVPIWVSPVRSRYCYRFTFNIIHHNIDVELRLVGNIMLVQEHNKISTAKRS